MKPKTTTIKMLSMLLAVFMMVSIFFSGSLEASALAPPEDSTGATSEPETTSGEATDSGDATQEEPESPLPETPSEEEEPDEVPQPEVMEISPASTQHTITIAYSNRWNETVDPGAAADTSVNVAEGTNYSLSTVPAVSEYIYIGYKIGSDAPVYTTNMPAISDVQENKTLTVIYGQDKTGDGDRKSVV